jgi:RNA polymerase sigma factor (sigma-70 family)
LAVTQDPTIEREQNPDRFNTTRWSLVLAAGDSGTGDDKAHAALTELCQIYWRPIFAFVCRRGYSIQDAQDLTQDFFLMVLEGQLLKRSSPERGRFRTLLLAALTYTLLDDTKRKRALKRGGNVQFVSWDDWMAEAPSRLTIPSENLDQWPAERVYDVRWAATVVERALRRLGEECQARGKRRVFDVLSNTLASDRTDVSYADLAKTLGVTETVVKRLVHELRKRHRTLLRDEVAQTVSDLSEVDDEVRYLCAALASNESQIASESEL